MLVEMKFKLQDDDAVLHSASSEHLGEIKLSIWMGQTKWFNHGPGGDRSNTLPSSDKVHEQAKTMANHRVKSVDQPSTSVQEAYYSP